MVTAEVLPRIPGHKKAVILHTDKTCNKSCTRAWVTVLSALCPKLVMKSHVLDKGLQTETYVEQGATGG